MKHDRAEQFSVTLRLEPLPYMRFRGYYKTEALQSLCTVMESGLYL